MIAQWDSPLSVLPVARVMIDQWDNSLSVLPVAQTMIAQWDSSWSVLPVTWVQFPTRPWRSILRDFSLADYMCCLVHTSGSTKKCSGAPLGKNAFSLIKIMRCLQISLVYGKTKTLEACGREEEVYNYLSISHQSVCQSVRDFGLPPRCPQAVWCHRGEI